MGQNTLLQVAANQPANVGVMAPNAPNSRLMAQNLNMGIPTQPGAGNPQPRPQPQPSPLPPPAPAQPSNYIPAGVQSGVPIENNYTPANPQSGIPAQFGGFGDNGTGNYTPANIQSGLQPKGPAGTKADDLV